MGFFSKTHFLLHHFYTIPACTFIALYNISYTRRFVEAQYLLGFVGSHGVAKTYETRQSDYEIVRNLLPIEIFLQSIDDPIAQKREEGGARSYPNRAHSCHGSPRAEFLTLHVEYAPR